MQPALLGIQHQRHRLAVTIPIVCQWLGSQLSSATAYCQRCFGFVQAGGSHRNFHRELAASVYHPVAPHIGYPCIRSACCVAQCYGVYRHPQLHCFSGRVGSLVIYSVAHQHHCSQVPPCILLSHRVQCACYIGAASPKRIIDYLILFLQFRQSFGQRPLCGGNRTAYITYHCYHWLLMSVYCVAQYRPQQ